MIPPFDAKGTLPDGIHLCSLKEIEQRFTYNDKRKRLFQQMLQVIEILKEAGCRTAYLDGSFINNEPWPNDYDLCWEPLGIRPTVSLKRLLDYDIDTRRQLFGGDIIVRLPQPPYHVDHVNIWQLDRHGDSKGIIKMSLKGRYD